MKAVSGGEKTNVYSSESITVMVKLPSSYVTAPSGYNRTFLVVHFNADETIVYNYVNIEKKRWQIIELMIKN